MPDEPAPVPPRSKGAGFYTWHSDRTLLGWLVGGVVLVIAIPTLLKARVSNNESAAIRDVRTVIAAEAAFRSMAGNYGFPECLAALSSASCVAGYSATAPTFVDSSIGSLGTKGGYERAFVAGDPSPTVKSPRGVGTYCYSAFPATVGQAGVRSFAGDQTGRICFDPAGHNLCTAGQLPTGCALLE